MNVLTYFRQTGRALRGASASSAFFALCVAAGVLSVVGVAALAETAERGLRARSRELLGGDLALEARRPLPDVDPLLPSSSRTFRVDLQIMSTMVRSVSGTSRLAELKAVTVRRGAFPLAGALDITPRQPLETLLQDDSVLIAPTLRDELGLRIGDSLAIGEATFRVAGFVLSEPEMIGPTLSLGPRILLAGAALERTKLLGFGNRIRHRTVLGFPQGTSEAELQALKERLMQRVPGGGTYVAIESHVEGQPALRSIFARVHGR